MVNITFCTQCLLSDRLGFMSAADISEKHLTLYLLDRGFCGYRKVV